MASRLTLLLCSLLGASLANAGECTSGFDVNGAMPLENYKRQPARECACDGRAMVGMCEACGSLSVGAVNRARFRVDMAHQAKKDGHPRVCAREAYAAMGLVTGVFEMRRKPSWKRGLKYATRWDGVLPEDQLFDFAQQLGDKANDLYRSCGGKLPLPAFTATDKVVDSDNNNNCVSPEEARRILADRAAHAPPPSSGGDEGGGSAGSPPNGGGAQKKCRPSGARCQSSPDCCSGNCYSDTKKNANICS